MHSQFGGGDFGFGVSRGSVGGGGSSSEISSGSSDFTYIYCNTRVIENKIRTENNEIIHMGVFPRRRAALRAARAAGWRGVD